MDTLRGQFGSFDDDNRDDDYGDDDFASEAPPSPVGQDERRMQVRAYNHWASLLKDRNFPAIEDLDPASLPDFGPHSVLLDFTGGIENPAIQYLGEALAEECGTDGPIRVLDDVPSRSLLSRITDHYMQILANQAPIGFEAEFVNQRSATVLYRGILLPFSSDDDTIDFIYGVINWKEVADQVTTDELLLEIDQALEVDEEAELPTHEDDPVTDWADGPANEDAAGAPVIGDSDVPEPGYGGVAAEAGDDHIAEGAADADADETVDANEGEEDEDSIAAFELPDLGDTDEEDTIDHSAFASLAPAGDEDDEVGDGPAGLMGLRNKPHKKPLDLSLASALEPLQGRGEDDGTDGADSDEDADVFEASNDEDDTVIPVPQFGQDEDNLTRLMGSDETVDETEDADDWSAPLDPAAETEEPVEDESADAPDAADPAPLTPVTPPASAAPTAPAEADGLYDTLAEARELAQLAQTREDRSRAALYDAVGRAYDVSLAAQEAPEDFAELMAENGLTAQERAPMTPVVKLVFGADYDKTRITEYATVLSHAHRLGLARGGLSRFLAEAEGGLKGVVRTERRMRREEEGKTLDPADEVREALAKKLRELEAMTFAALEADGPEFGVVMIRRLGNGEIVVLGEVNDDIPVVEKVARKLVG